MNQTDQRHHVQSMLMRESLIDKQVIAATEKQTPIVRMLPHVHVPMRYALFGGALGALLWLAVRGYYVWYLENVSKVGPLFGSLSAVILTLIWVYVSALAFLVGAEFTRWLLATDPKGELPASTSS